MLMIVLVFAAVSRVYELRLIALKGISGTRFYAGYLQVRRLRCVRDGVM